MYSDWKTKNDLIEGRFKKQEETINQNWRNLWKKLVKKKILLFFPYDANHEKAIKLSFSGNIKLHNGNKGTILGVKGTSKDGNTKFIRIFSQTGVLFKGDDKFTGDLTWSEVGGKKSLIGWFKRQRRNSFRLCQRTKRNSSWN